MGISFTEYKKGEPYLSIVTNNYFHKCIDLRKIKSIEYNDEVMKITTISDDKIEINIFNQDFNIFLNYWVRWLNFKEIIYVDYDFQKNIIKIIFENSKTEIKVDKTFYDKVLEHWGNSNV